MKIPSLMYEDVKDRNENQEYEEGINKNFQDSADTICSYTYFPSNFP